MKLRAFLEDVAAGDRNVGSALPIGELRFVLEYADKPNINQEAAAIRALVGTEAFRLRMLFEEDGGSLDRFLVLRFPGVERTMPQKAQLFDMAYEIATARDLKSCEPDLGDDLYWDPEITGGRGQREEAIGDAISSLCFVNKIPPADKRWALDRTGVLQAWNLSPNKGNGIVIAQPDTGVARHLELEQGALLLERATNILNGTNDPTDPLDPHTANPGHGTSTASVAVSRTAGEIAGSAPGAQLVPIRCIQDVKVLDAAPVAVAIDHARQQDCHVITMSLGGLGSRAMAAAIDRAIEEHIIVLAAAGNCVGLVVYPARYDAVIAVAGTNIDDSPWKGTCRGPAVTISAPAELVWRAERRSSSAAIDIVSGGQGTSFAVALVAGVAALWLAHHKRHLVIAEAKRRRTTVQALFAAAMKRTARLVPNWPKDDLGAGIIDAAAMLRLPLGDIPAAQPAVEAGVEQDDLDTLLAEVAADKLDPKEVDRNRFGLEIRYLAYEDALNTIRTVKLGPEAKIAPHAASQALCEAASSAKNHWLKEMCGPAKPTVVLRAPYVVTAHAKPARLLPLLAKPRGPGLESQTLVSDAAAREALTKTAIREHVEKLENKLNRLEKENRFDAETKALKQKIIGDAEPILRKLKEKGRAATIAQAERISFEALVKLTERPVLRVRGDEVDIDNDDLEGWKDKIAALARGFMPMLKSIGRIDAFETHIGTGFVIGPGLVATNRHVIEAFATPIPRRRDPTRWSLPADTVTIDFSDRADKMARRFKVKSVVFAGGDPIARTVEFEHLDMAVLEVETRNSSPSDLPPPIPLLDDPKYLARGKNLFVTGFPAQPRDIPRGKNGKLRRDILDRLWKLYGSAYGVKYFSPGEIDVAIGDLKSDIRRWVVAHDASTLGGNSGSCVIHLGDPIGVLGLHFAGDWLRANYAHGLPAVHASGRIPMPLSNRFTWI
jgi:serine protease